MRNIFLLLLISSVITLRGDARHLRHKNKHHVHRRNDPLLEALFNDIEPKPAPKLPRGSEEENEPLKKGDEGSTNISNDVAISGQSSDNVMTSGDASSGASSSGVITSSGESDSASGSGESSSGSGQSTSDDSISSLADKLAVTDDDTSSGDVTSAVASGEASDSVSALNDDVMATVSGSGDADSSADDSPPAEAAETLPPPEDEAPVEKPAAPATPVETSADLPAATTVEASADQPAGEPAVEASADQPASEPAVEASADQPAVESTVEASADQPAVEPAVEASADQPAIEPAVEAPVDQAPVDASVQADTPAADLMQAQVDSSATAQSPDTPVASVAPQGYNDQFNSFFQGPSVNAYDASVVKNNEVPLPAVADLDLTNKTEADENFARSFIPQTPMQFPEPQVQVPEEADKKSFIPIAFQESKGGSPLVLHKHIHATNAKNVIFKPEDYEAVKKSYIPVVSSSQYDPLANQLEGLDDNAQSSPLFQRSHVPAPPPDTMPEPIVTPISKAKTGRKLEDKKKVKIFKGLKAKEVDEDKCSDMYDSCPEFKKNQYCTKYPDLMKVQCKKSCKFCDSDGSGSGSGSGDELDDDDDDELGDESSSDDEPPALESDKSADESTTPAEASADSEPTAESSDSEASGEPTPEADVKEGSSAIQEDVKEPTLSKDDVASGGESDEFVSGSGSGSGSGDKCQDMYDTCPAFAKNEYCGKYADLMRVQCRKSCKFCESADESSASGSGSGVSSGFEASGFNDVANDVTSAEEPIASGESEEEEEEEPPPESADVAELDSASGSGLASGTAEGLAEDLATGTVKTEEKVVPVVASAPAPAPPPAPAAPPAFPRIDLKSIARAISMYRQAALQMMGESAPKSGTNIESKKSSIPQQPKPVPQLREYIQKVQHEDAMPAPPPAPMMPGPFDQAVFRQYQTNNFARSHIPSAAKSHFIASTDPYQYLYDNKGGSIEPIFAKLVEHNEQHSQGIVLRKHSPQAELAKKNHIPVAKAAALTKKFNVPSSYQAGPQAQVPSQQYAAVTPMQSLGPMSQYQVPAQQYASNMPSFPALVHQQYRQPIVSKSDIPTPKNITVPAMETNNEFQNVSHHVEGDEAAIRELRSFFEEEDD